VSRHDRWVSPLSELAGNRDRARCASETRLRPIRNDPTSLSSRNWTTKGTGRFFRAWAISYADCKSIVAHVFITASFELVLKGNNGALGVSTILVLLASSLDPMNLGCSRSTSLTSSSFRLTVSSDLLTW